MAKPALGRGLSALLGGASVATRSTATATLANSAAATDSALPSAEGRETVQRIPIHKIRPCPFQPRKDFSPESLQELADSIRSQGVIQPLIVRRQGEFFELIAGERRWRAAQTVPLTELPVIVREADDRSVLRMALIENLQRENLNPMEEAMGFSELIQTFQLRQEDAALQVGKSRASVANALRLLKLPMELQSWVRQGKLSTGHAKALLSLESAADQQNAASRVVARELSVRQTESLVAEWNSTSRAPGLPAAPLAAPAPLDPNLVAIETQLREKLGTKVRLRYAKGKGSLEVKFFSDDDLQRVLDLLGIRID